MKTIFQLRFVALFAVLALFSCKNAQKPTKPVEPIVGGDGTTTPEYLTPPETTVFAASVSKLNLRETPDAKGKVVTMLEKGTFLTATGKKSDKKVKIAFQGLDEIDFFYEVETADGKKGWVFGPAMTKIFAGKKSEKPSLEAQNFAFALGKLPTDAVETGGKAFDLFKTTFPKGGDVAYILLDKTFHDLQFNMKAFKFIESEAFQGKMSKIDTGDVWRGIFDANRLPETKRLAENGFRINTTEGYYFPTLDTKKLKSLLANAGLTQATSALLDYEVIEDEQRTSEDGGLAISIDELAKRAIFWDAWALKNQFHVLGEQGINTAKWLASDLLIGQDNTPAFDYETKKLNPDFQKAWETVLKTAPNTALAGKITTFQAAITADGGKRGPKTETLVKSMMDAAE
jgi:Bacterial SH3 domain